MSAATPAGVGPSSRRAVAARRPDPETNSPNFDPWVGEPQVTRPSPGRTTQMPSRPAQFVVFVASRSWSRVRPELPTARAQSMTSSGGRWKARVTGHAPGRTDDARAGEPPSVVQAASASVARARTRVGAMNQRPPSPLLQSSEEVPAVDRSGAGRLNSLFGLSFET